MAKPTARNDEPQTASPVHQSFSEALARGLEIIAAFGPEARALTLSDIARRVDQPRATVRRSLLTLVQMGYAEQNGRFFGLTPRVLELATAYLGASVATSILQPCCELLSAEYGETFSVAVLDGDEAVMIAYAMPRRMYMESAGVGLRLPAHCSAVGRVLLAGLSEARRELYLKRLQPRAITPKTVTSKPALRRIFAQVAQDGFAVADEEAELGFRSLAVPLRRAGGQVSFALNTGLPVQRSSTDEMRDRFLHRLLTEAERLRNQLL
jgi:IclR family pca regulon transcriptional regulator